MAEKLNGGRSGAPSKELLDYLGNYRASRWDALDSKQGAMNEATSESWLERHSPEEARVMQRELGDRVIDVVEMPPKPTVTEEVEKPELPEEPEPATPEMPEMAELSVVTGSGSEEEKRSRVDTPAVWHDVVDPGAESDTESNPANFEEKEVEQAMVRDAALQMERFTIAGMEEDLRQNIGEQAAGGSIDDLNPSVEGDPVAKQLAADWEDARRLNKATLERGEEIDLDNDAMKGMYLKERAALMAQGMGRMQADITLMRKRKLKADEIKEFNRDVEDESDEKYYIELSDQILTDHREAEKLAEEQERERRELILQMADDAAEQSRILREMPVELAEIENEVKAENAEVAEAERARAELKKSLPVRERFQRFKRRAMAGVAALLVTFGMAGSVSAPAMATEADTSSNTAVVEATEAQRALLDKMQGQLQQMQEKVQKTVEKIEQLDEGVSLLPNGLRQDLRERLGMNKENIYHFGDSIAEKVDGNPEAAVEESLRLIRNSPAVLVTFAVDHPEILEKNGLPRDMSEQELLNVLYNSETGGRLQQDLIQDLENTLRDENTQVTFRRGDGRSRFNTNYAYERNFVDGNGNQMYDFNGDAAIR